MTQLESKDLASSLPLLPRLHRLDFLVLEEKHGLSGGNDKLGEEENIADYCKATVSLSSALEEAHHKGTLVERLTALENRLFKLQLSLEMDEGNTSRSRKDNEDEKGKHLQEEASIAEAASLSTGNTNRVVVDIAKKRRKSYKKWCLGCLRLGCN